MVQLTFLLAFFDHRLNTRVAIAVKIQAPIRIGNGSLAITIGAPTVTANPTAFLVSLDTSTFLIRLINCFILIALFDDSIKLE